MEAPILATVPPITPAAVVAAEAAEAIEPLEKVSVAEAAIRHRFLDNSPGYRGPWLFEKAPYLRRPCECLTDPLYRIIVTMGPGQSGKSEIPNNWLLQAAIYAPANFVWLQTDKTLMGEYVREKIEPMIELCRELREKLKGDVGSDNVYRKEFKRGMIVSFIWPVGSQMRFRTAPNFVVDDYDDVPPSIGGQGDAITLLGTRQTTFEGKEKGFVGSSPALGVEKGIEALVASGTDERWTVECVHCRDPFVIDFEQLHFDKSGTPADAEESAAVACPENGCMIEPRDKINLIRSGDWVATNSDSDIASFRIDGLMGFSSWPRLARLYREAEIHFERSQDEGKLRAFVNTRGGKNYKSKVADRDPVDLSELEARALASDYLLGTVPPDMLCLTAAVDVQGGSFEVKVQAWKPGGESAVVDRFAILALKDGQTKLRPGQFPEHWAVLIEAVIWRRYPMAKDPELSQPIVNTAIDTGGEEGVTDNAFAFWNTCLQLGIPPTAITLIKGGNNPKARLLPPPTVDAKRKARKEDPDPELFIPNVNRFKDMIDIRLHRENPGPGYIGFPRDMDPVHLAEITAEEKVDGLWQPKKDQRRNEGFDLLVYNAVAFMRLGGTDTGLSWVPAWARPARKQATHRVETPQALAIEAAVTANPPKPRKRTRSSRMRLS